MIDLSILLAWLFLFGGLGASALLGYQMRGPKGVAGVLVAGFMATLLGLVLSAGIAIAVTECIDRLHACSSRPDENLSLWLYSTLAIPVYWLAMLAFPRTGFREH